MLAQVESTELESKSLFKRHLTEIENNLKLNHEEQFEQLETLQSQPLYVSVPTGQRCNLRCVFCSNRNMAPKEYTDLTYDEFLQFTDPIKKASRVQLYDWGEPFLNPAYERMFDHVAEHCPATRIHISTNGTLLTDEWIDKLLNYGRCLLNVSLNAATPETYARVMQRNLFHRVVEGLRRLVDAKEQRGVDDFVITLSYVTIKPNIHELPRFVKLCAELGIRYAKVVDLNIVSKNHSQLFLGGEVEGTRQIFLAARDIALKQDVCVDTLIHYPVTYFQQDRSVYSYSDLPADLQPVWKRTGNALFFPQRGECYEPWQTFMAMQSGAVYTCCRGREILGNLQEQSFEEIWNGEKYRAYRRSINSFRPPQACRECPLKLGFDSR